MLALNQQTDRQCVGPQALYSLSDFIFNIAAPMVFHRGI